MTPEEAIQLLHNRQYMQYKGNGKAVFIHPLTDEEVKMVESLISSQASLIARQQRMIAKAVNEIADISSNYRDNEGALFEVCEGCSVEETVCDKEECRERWGKWLEQAEEVVKND